MTSIKVPPDHIPALVKLSSLSALTASSLQTAVASAAARMGSRDLSPKEVGPIAGLNEMDLEQILEAVTGLQHVQAFTEISIDELLSDVSESVRSANQADVPAADIKELKERLRVFLNNQDLAIAAKTNVLRYEHERVLHSLRILTDARPIFGNDVQKPPELMTIDHILKIAFHRAGRLEEEFFALDEDDLKTLKEAVQRAEQKANSLRALLTKSQIKVASTD